MDESYCRHCQKRLIWRSTANDLDACKRCYHAVWHDTRRRICDYHSVLGALERGTIPRALVHYGTTVQHVAEGLLQELQRIIWRTRAKHEVPLLLTRCKRLAASGTRRYAQVE